MRLPAPLLVVTEHGLCGGRMVDILAGCIAAGARWIWLRDRDLSRDERKAIAIAVRAAATAPFALTIGGDADLASDLAEELDAAGVHLSSGGDIARARRRLGPAGSIGVSAHSLDEISRAHGEGADYATFSPIFASPSKPGYGPALGLEGLARAARLGLPIVALGGVNENNVGLCLAAGAAAAAAMGGVLAAPDPAAAVKRLLAEIRSVRMAPIDRSPRADAVETQHHIGDK